MIIDLIDSYTKVAKYNFEKYDDDGLVDKLIRKFSAIMMIVFASLLGIAQLVGKPIECWCPNEYSDNRCAYATTYCYITNLYVPVSNSSHLPKREDLQSHKILYYQWVPFIFMLQALMFYFPNLIWRILNSSSGFDLNGYIQALKKDESDLKNSPAVKYVTHHIETCFEFRKSYQHRGSMKKFMQKSVGLKFLNSGFYLTICYLFTKFMYLFFVFLQLYLINNWLVDTHYSSASNWIFGQHLWKLTERFPHMTLCKYEVFILTDPQLHWLQCTLPINIYLKKIYIVIYSWLIFLFFLLIANIVYNLVFLFNGKKYLINQITEEKIDENCLARLRNNIKADGLIVLKLLKSNTSRYYASNIVTNLYQNELKSY